MINWKSDIARMAYWKQLAAERDKSHILPWHLPRTAASEGAISAAELASGIEFPEEYKQFLRHADGWEGFHIATDLFGTPEILSGRARNTCNRVEVVNYMREVGFQFGDYIAIGSSNLSLEMFVLVSSKARLMAGGVIWFVDEEIDRFSSFHEFFLSMTVYNARVAEKMKGDFG